MYYKIDIINDFGLMMGQDLYISLKNNEQDLILKTLGSTMYFKKQIDGVYRYVFLPYHSYEIVFYNNGILRIFRNNDIKLVGKVNY